MDKTLDTYPSCEQCRHRIPSKHVHQIENFDQCGSDAVKLVYLFGDVAKYSSYVNFIYCEIERGFDTKLSACAIEGKYFEAKE